MCNLVTVETYTGLFSGCFCFCAVSGFILAMKLVAVNGRRWTPELLRTAIKEAKDGMGLGLYVSSVLAGRMGGDLRVDTPEGGGTRVTLSLKRAS